MLGLPAPYRTPGQVCLITTIRLLEAIWGGATNKYIRNL